MKPKDYDEKFSRGMMSVIGAIVFFILIPTLYFEVGLGYVPAEMDTEVLDMVMGRWMIGGIPLILAAFPRKYYAYGNVRKVYACILSAVLSVVWLLYITDMGDLSGLLVYSSGDTTVSLGFAVLGLILIGAGLKALTVIISVADYLDNREAYADYNRSYDTGGIRVPGRFD